MSCTEIPIIKIKKFLLKIYRHQNIYPQKSTTSTQARQEFLIKTFNSLCEEDQALLFNTGEFKHEVRQFQKPYDNQQAEQISLMV